MAEQLPRSFNKVEMAQIQDVKLYMSPAFDVQSWNHLRRQAKGLWPEKIITAVDGLRKWVVVYNKSTKTCLCFGMKLQY
jgi:hypothetical protein